jgi:triacylglycerol esterase/lipase EstA (alpha/beta hydrolase family)
MKRRRYRAIAALLIAMAMSPPAGADECVVLLHGLWRTENSMARLEKSLAEAGYRVLNIEYKSTKKSIELLAEEAVREGVDGCRGAESIHFVTHSMGGILLRQ